MKLYKFTAYILNEIGATREYLAEGWRGGYYVTYPFDMEVVDVGDYVPGHPLYDGKRTKESYFNGPSSDSFVEENKKPENLEWDQEAEQYYRPSDGKVFASFYLGSYGYGFRVWQGDDLTGDFVESNARYRTHEQARAAALKALGNVKEIK